jgi:Fur family iron response transcriptional regulator
MDRLNPTGASPDLVAKTPLLATEEVVHARFAASGIGCTSQRLLVGRVLFARDQHVSADRLLAMVVAAGARVSKATVYNTLNLFADHGLVRALQLDGDHKVFDSNTAPHHHLYDEQSGELCDVAMDQVAFARLPELPSGTELAGLDVVLRVRRRTP